MRTTRLAPSPTGALHLGNARSFALTWLAARAEGARLLLRIEDIDGPRKKPEATAQALEDLVWLGLDHDGEIEHQSASRARHVQALEELLKSGDAYACTCTRRDVEAAQSAPHREDEVTYPGSCRGRWSDPEEAWRAVERPVALRFSVPPGVIEWADEVAGRVRLDPSVVGGDFVIARYAPETGFLPGYQLAVTLDDAASGVDWVIRGDDLLSSTPRQILIQRRFGETRPDYAHLPLVVGPDGRRLAKRHGDTRVAAYREGGVSARAVLRWIAESSGLEVEAFDRPRESGFSWKGLPRGPVVVAPHRVADGPPRPA